MLERNEALHSLKTEIAARQRPIDYSLQLRLHFPDHIPTTPTHCNYTLIVTPPALSFNLNGFSSMHKSHNCSVRLCTLSCPFRALEQPLHPWCQGRLSPSALPLARSLCYISLRHAGVSHKLSLSCSTGRTRPVESTETAGVYSTPAVDGQLKAHR